MDALCGNLDNVNIFVFAMKKEDYAKMPMFTYGTNERVGNDKFRKIVGDHKIFKDPVTETVHNNYQHIYGVDSHNARHQSPIALEQTCSTRCWENSDYAFLLDLLEVNANFGKHHFDSMKAVIPIL